LYIRLIRRVPYDEDRTVDSFAFFFLPLMVRSQDKRGPSTPEERQRFVDVTSELTKAPLNENLLDDAKWAVTWLHAVPDVYVKICQTPFVDLLGSGYRYAEQIFTVYVLSMGVYSIEHPGTTADETQRFLAGVEGPSRLIKQSLIRR
jgi:hypothetical protein